MRADGDGQSLFRFSTSCRFITNQHIVTMCAASERLDETLDAGGAGAAARRRGGAAARRPQMTFQAKDVGEARLLYDQLAVLAPLLLALTAATPALRGLLADTDVRWDTIGGACDDRTVAERAPGGRFARSRCAPLARRAAPGRLVDRSRRI
jgi:hypothetical protein